MAPRKGERPHTKGGSRKGGAAAAAAGSPAAEPSPAAPPAPQQHQQPSPAVATDAAGGGEASLSALQQLEEKRRRLCTQLNDVERQIFDLETRYLEGCNPNANALKGYEGLLSQLGSSRQDKASPIAPEDRIFSASSTSAAPRA